MKRYALPAAIAMLIATNLAWAYAAVDQGVTLTYQGVTLEQREKALQGLVELSNLAIEEPALCDSGITRVKLLEALPIVFGDDVLVEEEGNQLVAEELVFTIEQDQLRQISLLDPPRGERRGED